MVNREGLKEIIAANKEYIVSGVPSLLPRSVAAFPKNVNKVVVLYGARRSGKSYILYDLFRKHKENALYVDFEDERLADFSVEDFSVLQEVFLELTPAAAGKESYFLLDEVQNVKGWEKFARRAVERGGVKVFVTGSSSKMMSMEIHTALRGRSWSVEVTPFSFKESAALAGIDIHTAIYGSNRARLKELFRQYLRWGGFPEILLAPTDFEKQKILNEYFEAMFFKDLVERFSVSNPHLLSLLMENAFSFYATRFSLTAFYKQFKQKIPFSRDTLFLYYRYLLDSMLLFEAKIFSDSSYQQTRNPAKIYAADTGLCRRLLRDNAGRVLENAAFLALRRTAQNIYYFSSRQSECDFIVKDKTGALSAWQVALSLEKHNEEREIRGLVAACQHIGTRKGVILTESQEETRSIQKIAIEIVPLWKYMAKSEG